MLIIAVLSNTKKKMSHTRNFNFLLSTLKKVKKHVTLIYCILIQCLQNTTGFPDGSVGKESSPNAGDTGDMGLIFE